MRIMTLNIWGVYFGNPVEERIDAIEGTLKKYSAEVFGIQEFCLNWHKSDLLERFSENYTVVSGDWDHTPLLFKTATFNLLESGHFLYANTPDDSKGVTWAVLEEKASGKKMGVLNTHLWWKIGDDHDMIREQNATELFAKMQEIREKYGEIPVFAFGDVNSRAHMRAMKYLNKNGVVSSYEIAEKFSPNSSHHGDPVRDENGIYRGKTTSAPREESLDHILTYKEFSKIKEQKVVEDQEILDATDHSPVYIDFEL